MNKEIKVVDKDQNFINHFSSEITPMINDTLFNDSEKEMYKVIDRILSTNNSDDIVLIVRKL